MCCSECGQYPCECCLECGNHFCECCSECGCYPCECATNKITNVNWPDPDQHSHLWSDVWQKLGAFNNHPVNMAAEFYLLETLEAGVLNHKPLEPTVDLETFQQAFKGNHPKLALAEMWYEHVSIENLVAVKVAERSRELLKEAVEDWFEPVYEYMIMAIGGELRHHPAVYNTAPLPHARSDAWCAFKSIAEQKGHKEMMLEASELFRDFTADGYGGEPWAQGSDLMYQYLEGVLGPDDYTNKKMFLDRVWTLEHNGGCYLNKINWNGMGSIGYMPTILNAHGAHPYPNFTVLTTVASIRLEVKGLVHLAVAAANVRRDDDGISLVEFGDADLQSNTCSSFPLHSMTAPRAENTKEQHSNSRARQILREELKTYGGLIGVTV